MINKLRSKLWLILLIGCNSSKNEKSIKDYISKHEVLFKKIVEVSQKVEKLTYPKSFAIFLNNDLSNPDQIAIWSMKGNSRYNDTTYYLASFSKRWQSKSNTFLQDSIALALNDLKHNQNALDYKQIEIWGKQEIIINLDKNSCLFYLINKKSDYIENIPCASYPLSELLKNNNLHNLPNAIELGNGWYYEQSLGCLP
jgi:hypothetical protein